MAKTLVGLYDDRATADRVADALKQHNIKESDIHRVSHGDDGSSSTFFGGSDLADSLSNRGVPEDDAMLFEEGVRRGGHLVVTRVNDDDAQRAAQAMNQHRPINLERRRAFWQKQGGIGRRRGTGPQTDEDLKAERENYLRHEARQIAEQEEQIPIIEEELRVGKRQVERGTVRVHTWVEEVPVEEQVHVHEENVEVERRNVDRPATRADAERAFQDRTIEMKETAEEVVAEKEARVTGEVVVKKTGQDHTETVRDTVRRTEVDVDETDGATRGAAGFDAFSDDFRSHHRSTFDGDYSRYEPAYRHGFTFGRDTRYRDRDFNAAQPDLRRSYEERHGKGSFDQVKDAVRHAYSRARARMSSSS